MRPGEHTRPPTLSEVVRRAVSIVDPDDTDADLGRLLEFFEDDDEPVRGVERLEERLAMALEGVDVEVEHPGISVAAALIRYLARQPGEIGGHPEQLLRVSARAEWRGDPPSSVSDYLQERGVTL